MALPYLRAQQGPDTFRWVDFHAQKDQDTVVWVSRSLAVEDWTAIREIGVEYDAALVVTTDMGGPDVHYRGKEPVAQRGVNAALALAYGRKLQFCSPLFQSVKFENGKAVVRFTESDGGLTTDGGDLNGFLIAGADKKFYFADAKIDGDTVVVSSPHVPEPIAVRYGWADLPKVNLFNQAGLPASTFRTDDWPL